MQYNFNNEIPIYLQIVEIIIKDITNDVLTSGNKIPSVRDYASKFKVNPNTVVKSLQILEEYQLIYTDSTNGKFVTNDLKIIKKYKEELFLRKITSLLEELKSLGYSSMDIINKIKEIEK